MRKLITYILFASIVAPLMVGCYDDKGNYNYVEVPELRIDTTGLGILPEYAVQRFEKLSIAPNIYFNGKLVNDDASAPLDYLWTMYSSSSGIGISNTIDTLGTERVLDAEITRTPSNYTVLLTVTNRENGLQAYFQIPCGVEGDIPFGGWLVFYERADQPGTSDVGQVVNRLTKPTAAYEKEFWNLYSSSNGEPMKGKPVKVQHTICAFPPNTEIVLSTDEDMVYINQSTFNRIGSYGDFFYDAPATPGVTAYDQYVFTGGGEIVITNNKFYAVAATGARKKFGAPRMEDYGELAPWLSPYHNRTMEAVVYDQTNGCFLYTPTSNVKFFPFAAQNPAGAFDVNNVGAELVMGDWGYANYEYLIMKKNNGYYLAVANFATATSASDNIGLGWYDMSSSPNISKITSMVAPVQGLYVLYGADSSVYNFFYTTGQPAQELWKAPSTDEKVSCVALQKYGFMSFQRICPNVHRVLHIATYNESTKEGKLYQYMINPTDASLQGDPIIYTVPGRVASMGWKVAMPGT